MPKNNKRKRKPTPSSSSSSSSSYSSSSSSSSTNATNTNTSTKKTKYNPNGEGNPTPGAIVVFCEKSLTIAKDFKETNIPTEIVAANIDAHFKSKEGQKIIKFMAKEYNSAVNPFSSTSSSSSNSSSSSSSSSAPRGGAPRGGSSSKNNNARSTNPLSAAVVVKALPLLRRLLNAKHLTTALDGDQKAAEDFVNAAEAMITYNSDSIAVNIEESIKLFLDALPKLTTYMLRQTQALTKTATSHAGELSTTLEALVEADKNKPPNVRSINFNNYLINSSAQMKTLGGIKDSDFLKFLSYVRPKGNSSYFQVIKWWKISLGFTIIKYFNIVDGTLTVLPNSNETKNVMTYLAHYQKTHTNKQLDEFHDHLLETVFAPHGKHLNMFSKCTGFQAVEKKRVVGQNCTDFCC
jgi:hypothetical protein